MEISLAFKEVTPYIAVVATIIWMVVCAFFDQKNHEVPTPLTLAATIIAILVLLVEKSFILAGFVVAIYLIGDISKKAISVPLAIAISLAASVLMLKAGSPVAEAVKTVFILIFWMIWRFENIGGADSNILIAITLFFGVGAATITVVVGGIVAASVYLKKRNKEQKANPMILFYAVGLAVYFIVHLGIGGFI